MSTCILADISHLARMLPQQRNPCTDCKSAQQCTATDTPYHSPKSHQGTGAVVWECGEGKTDAHTQTVRQTGTITIHFALLCQIRNVIKTRVLRVCISLYSAVKQWVGAAWQPISIAQRLLPRWHLKHINGYVVDVLCTLSNAGELLLLVLWLRVEGKINYNMSHHKYYMSYKISFPLHALHSTSIWKPKVLGVIKVKYWWVSMRTT